MAVLSGERIKHDSQAAVPLIKNLRNENVRAACYDVRFAADGCIRPDGRRIEAGSTDALVTSKAPLVLHPGDSAWVSTYETFALPADCAATVTLKSDLAAKGLFLLSGTLIDPGYRGDPSVPGADGRLHFFVANLGMTAIVLNPVQTPLASIQFLSLVGPTTTAPRPAPPAPPVGGLGFLTDLRELRDGYSDLREDVRRTRTLTEQVILLGYFVLATAVIGVSLTSLLSIGSSEKLVRAMSRATPNSDSGKALIAALAIAGAWTIWAVSLLTQARRVPSAGSDFPLDRARAIQQLRHKAERRSLAVILFTVVASSVVIWVAFNGGYEKVPVVPVWIALGAVMIWVAAREASNAGRLPSEQDVREEMDRIATTS